MKLMRALLELLLYFSGLNFADIMQRQGLYPGAPRTPYIIGYECSGVIEEIGEHVTGCEVYTLESNLIYC